MASKRKKPRRKKPELYPTEPRDENEALLERGEKLLEESRALTAEYSAPQEMAVNEVPEPRSEWLAQLRAQTVSAQSQAAHTIAELQAWRDEIDSTIAFLKAQRNER